MKAHSSAAVPVILNTAPARAARGIIKVSINTVKGIRAHRRFVATEINPAQARTVEKCHILYSGHAARNSYFR